MSDEIVLFDLVFSRGISGEGSVQTMFDFTATAGVRPEFSAPIVTTVALEVVR